MPRLTEYRDVPGFESEYEVNGLGMVWSKPRVIMRAHGRARPLGGKFLTPGVDRKGYLYVNLKSGGRSKRWYIHQLVAAVFVGPRPDGLHVLHGNGRKLDNRPSNLRYDTNTENMRDRLRHGTHHFQGRTACGMGHPYTPETTTYRPDRTGRVCVICRRQKTSRTSIERATRRMLRSGLSSAIAYGNAINELENR